jgi:glycosyltransferase involved in cell wall biosynthesis
MGVHVAESQIAQAVDLSIAAPSCANLRRDVSVKEARTVGRVLIFEPAHNGHHLQYVRILLEALSPRVADIRVSLGAAALSSREFSVHLAEWRSRPAVRFFEEHQRTLGASMYRSVIENANALRAAIREHVPDRVYVPYGDGLIQALGACAVAWPNLIPDVPIELLIMRGGFAYPASWGLKRWRHEALYQLSARARLDVLHVLDPLVYADIRYRGGRLATRARVIPEAVEPMPEISKGEARTRIGVPAAGRYLVCAGALDVRKGIGHLLRAMMKPGFPDDVRLLLVGKRSAGLHAAWEQARRSLGDRLILIDRYVNENEFACAIMAADVVVVPYPEHQGSSGLLVRAAAAGRYIVASDYGWIGWATQTFGLGGVVDVQDAATFQRALARGLEQAATHELTPAGRRFVTFHSAENHRAHWAQGLCQLIGQSNELRSWHGVIRPSNP